MSDDGGSVEEIIIHYTAKVSRRETALIPFIFFDENSAEIPRRYLEPGTPSADALWRYRRILELLGARMASRPTESITIAGSASSDEPNPSELARKRAESIKRYLVENYKIDGKRIAIQGRDKASHPSNNAYAEGREENRRAEIVAGGTLLAPITTADTARSFTSPGIRYFTNVESEAGLSGWEIAMALNGNVLRRLSAPGDAPGQISDPFTPDELTALVIGRQKLTYSLSVTDTAGNHRTTESKSITFKVDTTVVDAPILRNGPVTFGESIYFDYNSADLRATARTSIKRIRESLPQGVRLMISGFADESGDVERNRTLSLQRAQVVAREFPGVTVEIEGMGESMVLFPNDTPDGRVYSRSVRITAIPLPSP